MDLAHAQSTFLSTQFFAVPRSAHLKKQLLLEDTEFYVHVVHWKSRPWSSVKKYGVFDAKTQLKVAQQNDKQYFEELYCSRYLLVAVIMAWSHLGPMQWVAW